MDIEKRALYNLLRINHINDPSTEVESWQVLDYRQLSLENLWDQLSQLGISWEEETFLVYAQDLSSPEELAALLHLEEEAPSWHDQVYLLIFELWRRLLPDRQSLSIFCDELDFQINAYDAGVANQQPLQDLFARLQQLLEEYLDDGENPQKVFLALQRYCGNDLESFLCDFISEQIDAQQFNYAQELIEGFQPFLPKSLWLELFSLRLLAHQSPTDSQRPLKEFLKKLLKQDNLDLYFESLNHMIQNSEPALFLQVIKHLLTLIQSEEDFQELLDICQDYFKVTDQEGCEESLNILIASRKNKDLTVGFSHKDKEAVELLKLLEHSLSIS